MLRSGVTDPGTDADTIRGLHVSVRLRLGTSPARRITRVNPSSRLHLQDLHDMHDVGLSALHLHNNSSLPLRVQASKPHLACDALSSTLRRGSLGLRGVREYWKWEGRGPRTSEVLGILPVRSLCGHVLRLGHKHPSMSSLVKGSSPLKKTFAFSLANVSK